MHDIDDIAELFALIEDGMSREFTIYGYTMDFMSIFVWGALGAIIIGFIRGFISRD